MFKYISLFFNFVLLVVFFIKIFNDEFIYILKELMFEFLKGNKVYKNILCDYIYKSIYRLVYRYFVDNILNIVLLILFIYNKMMIIMFL